MDYILDIVYRYMVYMFNYSLVQIKNAFFKVGFSRDFEPVYRLKK